jgi:hypothetical protein
MTEEEQADVLNNRPMLAIYIHVHHRLETNCWYVGFSLLCQQTERVGHEEYMITETEELVGAEFALF